MSTFSVPVKRIRAIEPHPNADAIEFAVVEGYRSIVKKGVFKEGDRVVYLPEASVLPEGLLKLIGMWDEEKGIGQLVGKKGDRIKAIKLRGELSQGICLAMNEDFYAYVGYGPQDLPLSDEEDVAQLLGVTKYAPPVPVHLSGDVFNAGERLTLKFDVENWQSYPEVLQTGESVVITEKLHGTFTGITVLPYKEAHPEAFGEKKNILIYSKGLGAAGLVFKNNEKNANVAYCRATQALIARIDELQQHDQIGPQIPFTIMGETYGPKIQDLSYENELGFRVFAMATGYRNEEQYLSWAQIEGPLKEKYGFNLVPVLYKGPFSVDKLKSFAQGPTTLEKAHIREGVVVAPTTPRVQGDIGNVMLKLISPEYLTRKSGTEYN